MKIAIVLPDGVGIRNFVLGSFLREFDGQALLLHGCPADSIPRLQRGIGERLQWQALLPMRDGAVSFTLRQALSYAHQYWADTHSMRFCRARRAGRGWRVGAARSAARAVGRLTASRTGIRMMEETYFRLESNTPEVAWYRDLFERTRPQVLLSSNQRAPAVLAPVLAARTLGIPTAAFVGSWDNLTTKGRIAAPFDHFLVWSEHMRGELRQYYPHIAADRVHIVGSPQFDPYGEAGLLWSREEFFRRVGADLSRPLICYSGGDVETCPEDQGHVEVLLNLIRARAVRGNPQVLVRPTPADNAARYARVRAEYPELLFAAPAWAHADSAGWARCVPTAEDVQFLSNLTHHSDINVNIASTMTLDFGLHDKPVVNIGYDLSSPPPLGVPVGDLYYSWEHYRPVVELGSARVARSPEQLAENLNAYLADPALDRQGRRALVKLQIGVPPGQSGQTALRVLRRLANAGRADSFQPARRSHEAAEAGDRC